MESGELALEAYDEPQLMISPLSSRIRLPGLDDLRAYPGGLSLSISVSTYRCSHLSSVVHTDIVREDIKCVLPDDRARDEGEGPPFVCVRGRQACEAAIAFSAPI
jgi:hypothetical protein